MQPSKWLTGFTLTELIVVVAIIGALAALTTPAFSPFIEKRRLIGATELVYSQMTFARNESVKRAKPMPANRIAMMRIPSRVRPLLAPQQIKYRPNANSRPPYMAMNSTGPPALPSSTPIYEAGKLGAIKQMAP